MNKQSENYSNKHPSQYLKSKPHNGLPTISRFEQKKMHRASAREFPRQIALLDVIEERFAQIFVSDLMDTPHRAASGDSDHLNEPPY